MKTVNDVQARALQILGVVGAGQSANIEDLEAIDLVAVAASLLAERVCDLTGQVAADEIDDAFMIPFAEVAAADHAAIFGQALDWSKAIRQSGVERIEYIIRADQPVAPLRIEYVG